MPFTEIDDPSAYFKVQLYTGTGSSHAITFNDTDTEMQPDLVWNKSRVDAYSHNFCDSVRGVTKMLEGETTAAESTNTNAVTAFGSNGFTVGSDNGNNKSSSTFVAWCWKESATSGFDIVTYTGDGSTRTVSHSLSAVPKVIICKSRGNTDGSTSAARNWNVYHAGIASDAETDAIFLDLTNAASDDNGPWNDTAPTSSVWSMGNHDGTNLSNLTYVAYLFAEKQGFSKFGKYTGNGNADGTFVYTGFRPAFTIIKKTNNTQAWIMWDNKRNDFNIVNHDLQANDSAAEGTASTTICDYLSNGFKLRGSGAPVNASGDSFIYMAFAEAPFVNSKGVPCNAR